MIQAKTKRWGNSIGIVVPSSLVEKLNLKPEEEVMISVEKKSNVLKELFGALKNNKKSSEQMIKEARKELESKWLK